MTRRSLSPLARLRIFDAAKGHCHICELRIQAGERWDIEHIKPLWLGGKDEPENMKPAHFKCHGEKTSGETSDRAKSDRVRAKHLGIRKESRRPLAGTRASGMRKRMNGEVERW